MSKSKQKYYVVWQGKKTGIFSSWEDCKKQINGFFDAKFKSFPDLHTAEKALKDGFENHYGNKNPIVKPDLLSFQQEMFGKPDMNSVSVDAACSGNPGILEYRGVETATGKEIFRQGPFPEGTNNIGEFLALVHGLALLKKNNSDLPIYSDSATAISWVKSKKAKTKLTLNEKNSPLFELIQRAENWLRENKFQTRILKWLTEHWGEIPADFGRKK
jgi:ribonuclease HI